MKEGLAVAGAVVGFVVTGFNPAGAAWGFQIGYTVGSLLEGPTTTPGPKLGDLPVQTSSDSVPIPLGWGIVSTHGNIIQLNPLQEVITRERQGKGGGGTVVEYTNYFRTFAIGVCRSWAGPIKGILRIWENDKLVYDMRTNPAMPIQETLAYAENIRIYLGTEDQTPDPDLEAHWGVGNCPHYRGLSYVVWVNYDITDFGAAIPRYLFEVEIQGPSYVTSRIYAQDQSDGLLVGLSAPAGALELLPTGQAEGSVTPISLEMRQTLKTSGPFVDQGEGSIAPISLEMRQLLKSSGPFVDQDKGSATPISLEMSVALVRQVMAPDKLQIGISHPTGTMAAA